MVEVPDHILRVRESLQRLKEAAEKYGDPVHREMTDKFKEQLRDHAINTLNVLVSMDQIAMNALVEYRVEVNDAIKSPDFESDVVLLQDEEGELTLGVLGLINGILGPNHKIAGCYNDEGVLWKFQPAKMP
jgi:hypothetical protein